MSKPGREPICTVLGSLLGHNRMHEQTVRVASTIDARRTKRRCTTCDEVGPETRWKRWCVIKMFNGVHPHSTIYSRHTHTHTYPPTVPITKTVTASTLTFLPDFYIFRLFLFPGRTLFVPFILLIFFRLFNDNRRFCSLFFSPLPFSRLCSIFFFSCRCHRHCHHLFAFCVCWI